MKVIRTVITVILLAALLITGGMIEKKLNEYRTAQDIHKERTLQVREGRKVDFTKLKEQSDDVIGWIYLPDSNIDYPVVQGEDNDFYLHRDVDGSYLYDGSIFADALVERPFESFNTPIYGHRMISGAMFADLKKFEDKEFMDSHKVFQIETPDRSYDLHVVAFCMEQADSPLYTVWNDDPASEEPKNSSDIQELLEDAPSGEVFTKADFVELVKTSAVTLSGEPFDEGDSFVTLSTCARSLGDDRNQVICVVKDAEMEEKVISHAEEKPFVNKWLLLQIAVGLIMALVVIFLLLPVRKKR